MPPKKTKSKPNGDVLNSHKNTIARIASTIWSVILQIVKILKSIFVILEKGLKIVAIFIITITASILFLVGSLYLFTKTFEIQESPAFKELRDNVAAAFVESLEDNDSEKETK